MPIRTCGHSASAAAATSANAADQVLGKSGGAGKEEGEEKQIDNQNVAKNNLKEFLNIFLDIFKARD